jgi:hypothetical protein
MGKMTANIDTTEEHPHAANEHDELSLWPYELELMQKLSKIHPLRAIVIRSPHLTMRAWFEDKDQPRTAVITKRHGHTLH